MKKIFLLLATIAAAISCNNNEMDSAQQGDGSNKSLTLNVATSAPMTKVDITENGDSWQVTWNANDVLGGWSKDTDYQYSTKFTIDNIDASGKNAEFTGDMIYNANSMRLLSPYSYDLSKSDNKIEISLETQKVGSDFSHLGATTYMLSNEFDIESVSSDAATTQNSISMRHIGAAIELAMKFKEPATKELTLTGVILGSGDGIKLPTTGEVNIEDGSFATTATGEIELNVANVEAVDGIYTIRFSTFPFSVASGKAVDLVAEFVDSSNSCYTAEASIINSGANFEVARASKNYLYAKLSEAKAQESVEKTLTLDGALGFPSASSSSISTIDINGIKFTLCNAWYNEYYGSYTITKQTNGYFYNTTPLTSLSKVVVTEDYKYYNYTVYAGKSAGDKATKLSYTKSGNEYTYSIPAGYDFITFVNEETKHNATCDKIVFTYGKNGSTGGNGGGNEGGSTEEEDAISYDFHFTSLTEEDDIVYGDATYTDEKINFVVNDAYYASSYGTATINEGGYIYNTTALNKGLVELVINYQTSTAKYQSAKVYVGTTSNPTTEISADSTNDTAVTYTIPETTTHFKIVSPKGYIRIKSIELNTESTSTGGNGGESGNGGDSGDGDDDYTPSIPSGDGETRYAGWAELPIEDSSMAGDYYYAYHMRADKSSVRNYTVCYSKDKMCPVWVASPMHSSYKGSANRTDAYKDDPDIPINQNGRWSGYTRGHMLGSSDRLVSSETNRQVFYHSNIAPQLGYVNGGGFNTGGGVWNNLEDYTDGQWCSDTLYLVNGSYWANENTKVDGTVIPTHYYKVMLRTKSGNSGKAVWDCSRDELKCVAFIVEHNTKQHKVKPHEGMMRTVEEMEKMTGHKFFTNVPNAPKDSYKASEWGI